MNRVIRKWDTLDKERQRKCIHEVMTRVDEIDEHPTGVIVAQEIIDIVTSNLAPEIYNKGIRDAKKLIYTKIGDMEFDIDALEQRE